MTTTSDSSVYYHDGNPDDPFVDHPNQRAQDNDWTACYACDCNGPEDVCRCSCHTTKRYH